MTTREINFNASADAKLNETGRSVSLAPDETAYLLKLLAEHLSYFATLAGSSRCTDQNRASHAMLERLTAKLREH